MMNQKVSVHYELPTEFGNAGTQVLVTLRIIRLCKGEGSGQQYKPLVMPIIGKDRFFPVWSQRSLRFTMRFVNLFIEASQVFALGI